MPTNPIAPIAPITTPPAGLLNTAAPQLTVPTPPINQAQLPVAPVATYTAAQATGGVANANAYTATPYKVENEGLVENRIKGIVAADSPLMQQARDLANARSNERGMLNSSIGTAAAQSAVIGAATPIATADANAINTAMTNTASSQNAASQFNSGAATDVSKLNAQIVTSVNQSNAGATNAARDEATKAANVRAIASLDINSKLQLADMDARYRALLQVNQDVASAYNQTIQNLATIANNKELSPEAKLAATATQMNMLHQLMQQQEEVATVTAQTLGSLNLGQYFNLLPSGKFQTATNPTILQAGITKNTAAMVPLQTTLATQQQELAGLSPSLGGGRGKFPNPAYTGKQAMITATLAAIKKLQDQNTTSEAALAEYGRPT